MHEACRSQFSPHHDCQCSGDVGIVGPHSQLQFSHRILAQLQRLRKPVQHNESLQICFRKRHADIQGTLVAGRTFSEHATGLGGKRKLLQEACKTASRGGLERPKMAPGRNLTVPGP